MRFFRNISSNAINMRYLGYLILSCLYRIKANQRFNQPSTTALSKEDRGRLSRFHDLPRTKKRKIASLSISQGIPPLSLLYPEGTFSNLLRDSLYRCDVCASPDVRL